MKSGFLLLSTLALLVAGVGCPNSTPIDSGTGSVTMAVSNTNLGKWTGGFATVSIYRVAFRALDPDAEDRQGTRDFLLTTEPIVVFSTEPDVAAGFFEPVYLAPGSYEIVALELADFYYDLIDYNFSVTECELLLPYNGVFMTDFPTPLTFTVEPGTDDTVQFTFNMEALGDAIEAAFVFPPFPYFCEGDIDVDAMAAAIGTYLTID